jgi:hypothetical protein
MESLSRQWILNNRPVLILGLHLAIAVMSGV